MQWNIQWCRGMDGVVDPARIARVARELADPDVLCLQEVAINFPALAGSSGEDQVTLLLKEFPGYAAAFGPGVDVPDGAGGRRRFGNLVLSRHPMRQILRHTLPWPAEDGKPGMPRTAVEAVIDAPIGPLRVIATHLEYYSALARAEQVRRLRELHAEACGHGRAVRSKQYRCGPFEPFARPQSAILAGDFNMRVDEPAYAQLQDATDGVAPRLVDAWTQAHPGVPHPPSFCLHDGAYSKTPYCCDFVFLSEDLLPRLTSMRIDLDTQASDHQPVIIELC